MEKINVGEYGRKLQDIALSDSEWKYNGLKLPGPHVLDRHGLIKSISLVSGTAGSHISIRLQKLNPNRATQGLKPSNLLSASFMSFRPLHNIPDETGQCKRWSAKETTGYIAKLLRAGIEIQGVHYNFYGYSNSQLKSRTCLLLAASKKDISMRIESFGDFSKMKTVAKKAKRIGLLFSSAEVAMIVDPARCEDIPDVENDNYIFTDGCGSISPRFAQELSRRLRLCFRVRRYSPSVFQLRYKGYKGVVTVDPTMKDPHTLLKFRKSMKKFNGGDDNSFSVVEYSKPYVYGHLNDEVVILLSALGIPAATLLRKQEEHFKFLSEAPNDPRAGFRFLCHVNRPELAEKLLLESLDVVRPEILKLTKAEKGKMINKRDTQKCRILVPKSRLLFGVCDAWGVLKPGECHVKVTTDEDGQPQTLKDAHVLVTRNPCLHPGDLQKLRLVDRPELSHLVDCIVFPIKGKRPSADMMSGGDLDGDTFFVCWDQDLMPSKVADPALYPGAREPVTFKPITDDDRLQFFSQYSSVSLGRVKNLYLDWVKVKGPMASECQELNRLFSQCVDGNRIQIPPKLERPPDPPPNTPPFILDVLHEAATRLISLNDLNGRDLEGYDFDAIELLLNRDRIAISEFELIQLTFKWCRKNDKPLQDLLHFFDFNSLSAEEKTWTIGQVPVLPDVPNLVMNALCSSNLVTIQELKRFTLDHPRIGWKRVYDSSHDRMATFLEETSKSLELFHRKLIILRVDERLTIAIYVPKKIEKSQDYLVDNHVRLFAFPHSQGPQRQSRLCLPTKMSYRLYSDDNAFQLFEGQRRNTWIHIRHGGSDDSSYRNKTNTGDRRRQRQETLDSGLNYDLIVSVALDKFSNGLRTHIGRVNRNGVLAAEIYVITNRDVQSMHNLDLWLQYIDTEDVMPLFDEEPREYSIPDLASIDLTLEPEYIALIAKADLSILGDIESADHLSHLFTWLCENNARDLLLKSVNYLLTQLTEPAPALPPADVLDCIFASLDRSPFISICFANLDSWKDLPEELALQIENRATDIIRGLILCANDAQELVLKPLQKVFSQIESMSLSAFAELVELVALTVRSPTLAMDVLLECFEPESSRLLHAVNPLVVESFKKNMIGIAIDHIGEVEEEAKERDDLLTLKLHSKQIGRNTVVMSTFRVDSPGGTPEASAHVRLTVANQPANISLRKLYSMDALVTYSEKGMARFQCLHPLPRYFEECSWRLTYGAPFVTTKAMLTAVTSFATDPETHCSIWRYVLGDPSSEFVASSDSYPTDTALELNTSQKNAVKATLESPLVCLWGPPGTGKTQTIAAAIVGLERLLPKARILVTAPTHNAVDNVMRRYISIAKPDNQSVLRVSTEVRKVAEDLRTYTLDAMAGMEIYSNPKTLKESERRVKGCRLAFTTCIGAGIGLLRKQSFEVVVIDEASQQTEPASFVPLTKGCQRALLVGDHVQLRPTVQRLAAALDFDVSLFERLYKQPAESDSTDGIPKLMLDTQYRMHPSICKFSSDQFYDGKLHTGIMAVDRPLGLSSFPWPEDKMNKKDKIRTVFIPCDIKEGSIGQKSKMNEGQAVLCQRVCKLLSTPAQTTSSEAKQDISAAALEQSIAVLTPYARQLEVLKGKLAGMKNIEASSIDGYQGREADIVVFVTTRCNVGCEIGFLKDLRRMNVALTRARAGLIVIGHRETLTQGTADPESTAMWKQLLTSLTEVTMN